MKKCEIVLKNVYQRKYKEYQERQDSNQEIVISDVYKKRTSNYLSVHLSIYILMFSKV